MGVLLTLQQVSPGNGTDLDKQVPLYRCRTNP